MTDPDAFVGGYGPGIKHCVSIEEAQEIRQKLEAVGASVQINSYNGNENNDIGAHWLFDAVLVDVGPNKIHVIKAIRELTKLGIKEAKEMVEDFSFNSYWTTYQLHTHGRFIKRQMSKTNAELFRLRMAEVGAKVILVDGRGQRWVSLT